MSAGSAHTIIVLGVDGRPHEADLHSVRIMAALAALPDGQNVSGKALAEVHSVDTVPVIEAVLPSAHGIHTRSAVYHLLCYLMTEPAVGDCLVTMSSFLFGEALYCVRPIGLFGYTFEDACRCCKGGLCVGIRFASGDMVLAPPNDKELREGDMIFMMSSKKQALLSVAFQTGAGRAALVGETSGMQMPRSSSRGRSSSIVGDSMYLAGVSTGVSTVGRGLANTAVKGASAAKTGTLTILSSGGSMLSNNRFSNNLRPIKDDSVSYQNSLKSIDSCGADQESESDSNSGDDGSASDAATEKDILVCVGFSDDFCDIVQTLDGYVRQETAVHVLSAMSLDQRQVRLRRKQLRKIDFVHHVGATTAVSTLERLPLAKALAVIVLGESMDEHDRIIPGDSEDAAGRSDSESLACAVTIASICHGRFGHPPCQLRGRILCEVLSAQTEAVISRSPAIQQMITFFRSNVIVTGLFVMAAHDPIVFNMLHLMLTPGSGVANLKCVSFSTYTWEAACISNALGVGFERVDHLSSIESANDPSCSLPGACPDNRTPRKNAAKTDTLVEYNLTFWEVHDIVRRHDGDLLVGWVDTQTRMALLAPDIDRDVARRWNNTMELLILRCPREDGALFPAQQHHAFDPGKVLESPGIPTTTIIPHCG